MIIRPPGIKPKYPTAPVQPGADPARGFGSSIIGQGRSGPDPFGPGGAYDLSTDPILQQIRANNALMISQAEAAATAAQKRLLIDYGDPELASALLHDQSTSAAAGQNPYSALGNMRRSHEQGVSGINEALNKQNLYYSSTRGKALGEEASAYGQEQAGAARSLQDSLSGIAQNLLGTRQEAAQNETQGLQDAYQNALAFALQYGINPGAGAKTPVKPPTRLPASFPVR